MSGHGGGHGGGCGGGEKGRCKKQSPSKPPSDATSTVLTATVTPPITPRGTSTSTLTPLQEESTITSPSMPIVTGGAGGLILGRGRTRYGGRGMLMAWAGMVIVGLEIVVRTLPLLWV